MCNTKKWHSYLNRQTIHQGRAPWIESISLHKILIMYRELRDRDRIVTLNILAAELKRLDRSVQGMYLADIQCHIWCHTKTHGVVWCRVTHVAQNTRYEQSIIQGWVYYVNQSIKIVNYKACYVVNIDVTNVNFDLASQMTLDGHGE
jgi:hypothetical protein